MNYCICKCCNSLFSIITTCSEHFYNNTQAFITFNAVDTILYVISGGVPYTARAFSNVGTAQENSMLSKCLQWSFQTVGFSASEKVMDLSSFFIHFSPNICLSPIKLQQSLKIIFLLSVTCKLLSFCICAFFLAKQILTLLYT